MTGVAPLAPEPYPQTRPTGGPRPLGSNVHPLARDDKCHISCPMRGSPIRTYGNTGLRELARYHDFGLQGDCPRELSPRPCGFH